MRKSILIAIAAISMYPCFGQGLSSKIPTEAQYVLTVNTPNMLSKMSIAEMDDLALVNKTVTSFVKGRKHYDDFAETDEALKINDLGFDFTKQSYFFIESTDSITYFAYLIELNDPGKFAALNDTSLHWIKNTKNLKIIGNTSQIIAWNKTTALFLSANRKYDYFNNQPAAYGNYSLEEEAAAEEMVEEIMEGIEEAAEEEAVEIEVVEEVVAEELFEEMAYEEQYNYNYPSWEQQDSIVLLWMEKKVISIFAKKNKKAPKHVFLKHADNNAALTMWSSPKSLYTDYFNMWGLGSPKSDFPGGELIYHAYLNKDNLTLRSAMSLDDKERKSYENMFSNQLNPKFFNYIDANKNLSYYSYAYSVKGLLEEVPNVIGSYLGASFSEWGIQESVDLLSVVIDEEAIGNVVCGDGILVLTAITNKEVTYTDYEWDEDFMNKTEVTKTKNEVIPEFLYMLSTKDEASIEKIFKLSMKSNKQLIKEDGYYSLELYNNAPFKIYFVVRDGIIFMCNSDQQLQDILNNKEVESMSSDEIKAISNTPLYVSVDGKKIVNAIPEDQEESERNEKTKRMMHYTKSNIGNLSIEQNLDEKDGLIFETVYSFSNGAENSLKYFFTFFNDIYLIEKGDK